ncbi:MAG: acyl-CoA/acyl-ACP dehydrogenase [Pirellulales bacterium]|nr:acyl-CoA/acyl-ACP dehydrogenase [Pirellulales bacterium]
MKADSAHKTAEASARAAILADVEAYCEELRPLEELCYLERRFNPDIQRLALKHNLLGMPLPVDLGGRGADYVTYARALARIGREGTGVRTFFSGQTSIGQYPILRYGNRQQQERYLPRSAAGELVMAFGLTEPDAGSNPLEMTTTYRRDGDRYLLNGVKYLISNGSIADVVVGFGYPADKSGPQRRMSAFIIETAGDTFVREELHSKPGMYTANTGMFEMVDHPVPVENLLGGEGNGFRIAMGTLVSGRLSVAAGCLGVIEDCLAEALNYSRTRSQHGKLIGKHQLVQEHLAEIEMARVASEALVLKAAEAKAASDADRDNAERAAAADIQVAQAKFFATNAAWQAADRAVQVFGGRGWSELYRVGRHLQDVRVCRIYEGTDEILKLKIAASLLGREFNAFS